VLKRTVHSADHAADNRVKMKARGVGVGGGILIGLAIAVETHTRVSNRITHVAEESRFMTLLGQPVGQPRECAVRGQQHISRRPGSYPRLLENSCRAERRRYFSSKQFRSETAVSKAVCGFQSGTNHAAVRRGFTYIIVIRILPPGAICERYPVHPQQGDRASRRTT
jgi:hypothetical protein